ncbi:glucose-1-phosphate thymidylyltransferase [Haloarcula nitratireducens]|uniref:Glucose-1-phosphate thymidylyltransferase n=1 Tax=Haloarcula nitratireducens TaxID=2487749 RepID=A0AAW4PI33_9EURY|nr:glucose-1-phosphate thymidylyltransferase [Halomicroarcula nitratireducens]MBX0297767.1 glucose-1-phosphate thymidylyltransferase [Halomicroarcula nitratireducens]
MKGVILAGGTGSRLQPITHTRPKQLVPIGNKPVIVYAIENLREAGIDDIGVILGTVGRRAIQDYLGDGSEFGVEITYIIQGEPLGLAHAVGCARDFVGNEPFVVYLGDDMIGGGITDLVADFDPTVHAATIGVQEVDEPSRYGIVDTDSDGNVTRLLEKPDSPPSNLALIGIYVFTPDIFEQIELLEPSWRGELEITEAIQGLLDDGYSVQSHVVHGWWKDTGKPEDMLQTNRLVLDNLTTEIHGEIENDTPIQGRIKLGEGSTIESGAVVRGPVSIGQGTTVGSDAYIGPYTSIGENCVIDTVHIESSIVIGESEIDCDRKLVDSLIGRQTTIVSSGDIDPGGERLVVGENSTLKL